MANKKRQKKSSGNHATQSFAQVMSAAQLNALKPFIEAQVQQATNQLAMPMFQQITRLVMENLAQVQNRLLAVERIIDIDRDRLAEELANIEDEATGLVTTEEAAVAGDQLRVSLFSKDASAEEYPEEDEKILIPNLLQENAQGEVQTHRRLEEHLVGMKAGETSEFLLPAEDEEAEGIKMKITLLRVSRKPKEESNAAE